MKGRTKKKQLIDQPVVEKSSNRGLLGLKADQMTWNGSGNTKSFIGYTHWQTIQTAQSSGPTQSAIIYQRQSTAIQLPHADTSRLTQKYIHEQMEKLGWHHKTATYGRKSAFLRIKAKPIR